MKKILIVDDQLFIREVFKHQLDELTGFNVIEAANGNEAVGKAKVFKPDLILMDIVMPKKDGLQALEELKNNPSTKDIPVIIITSHADEEKRQKARDLGVSDFIDKADLRQIDLGQLLSHYL